jgi:hypothetical protein
VVVFDLVPDEFEFGNEFVGSSVGTQSVLARLGRWDVMQSTNQPCGSSLRCRGIGVHGLDKTLNVAALCLGPAEPSLCIPRIPLVLLAA